MGLDVLGLGIVEHRIYEHLVRHRALSAADLAIELGLRDAQVGSAIDALTTRGLVAREGPAPGRLIAAPPDVALGGLILDHEDRLRQAQAEMLALEQLYRNAGTGEADVVDVVRGSEAVGHRFNQLQRSARSEVLLFVKGDIVAIDREQNVEEELAHQRGIRYRYVLERARLEAPGMLDAVRGAIEVASTCASPARSPRACSSSTARSPWCPRLRTAKTNPAAPCCCTPEDWSDWPSHCSSARGRPHRT